MGRHRRPEAETALCNFHMISKLHNRLPLTALLESSMIDSATLLPFLA